jgi:hypothetical protein
MEVKIYREAENEELILNEEQLAEYNQLATKLGLQTQEKQDTNKTPNIYVSLNTAMQKQLQAICPMIVDADKYKKSTIPLEVLKVYDFAKENEMFDGYQVWYNDVDPDPLLIGWTWQSEEDKEKNYSWRRNRFLIARWGDCAMELPELLQLGFDNLKQQLTDKAKSAILTSKMILEEPEIYVRKLLKEDDSDMRIDLNTSASNTIY